MSDKKECIAIIGISCRFPGDIKTPAEFWDFMCNLGNGITEIPGNRWNLAEFYDAKRGRKGKYYTKKGGFLKQVNALDSAFFRVSPREAAVMDPQQKLLLELTWEALEDGGIVPSNLSGGKTGVYIGLFMHDFSMAHYKKQDPSLFDIYSGTGVSSGIAANRISYFFNFKGPSLVIDTACSSSLVAAHYGCRDLLAHDTDVAIIGGVNLMLIPEMYIVLCQANMLSPDGYCKAFDSRADGYARAEGAGVVVLKRLSDAIRDEDPIYATILGSAVNQDGLSEGLTVPNGDSQEAVIKEALLRSGVNPNDVHYVEAHGTGTEIGDPIEARSLGRIFSQDRKVSSPLKVGSVKTNIGHTESAAGIAGLIKTALILYHKKIPANLHFETPNPKIPFRELQLEISTELEDWHCEENQPRIAGVNSFGFGGTNAHVILKEYTALSEKQEAIDQPFLVPLSAHNDATLGRVIERWIEKTKGDFQNDSSISLRDIACTAALRRSHHLHRTSVLARSISDLSDQLEQLWETHSKSGIKADIDRRQSPLKIAFVFSGMGQQWPGMGKYLFHNFPECRSIIESCDALFKQYTQDWSVRQELLNTAQTSRINETQVAQPCIFTLQVALFELWKKAGISPISVVGHSVGEIAAIHCAGILSLEDAVHVAYHRSRLQHATSGQGRMLAVGLSALEIRKFIDIYEDRVEIGAINSPQSVVLSGDSDCLKAIAQELEFQGIFNRFLNVEVPYHSYIMDSIVQDLAKELNLLRPQVATIPLVSTVTGNPIIGNQVNADYWCKNVRQPVLFKKAIESLLASGHNCFLEISAHSVLSLPLQETIDFFKKPGLILGSINRSEPGSNTFLRSLGSLYQSGVFINWKGINDYRYSYVRLPTYPWQQDLDRNESVNQNEFKDSEPSHPLLGSKIETAVPIWKSKIDVSLLEIFKDHVIFHSIVYPASAYLEMAIAAGLSRPHNGNVCLMNIEIRHPLLLQEERPVTLQLILSGINEISIFSKQHQTDKNWTTHFTAELKSNIESELLPAIPFTELVNNSAESWTDQAFYQALSELEFNYGPRFRNVETVWKNQDTILAKISGNTLERSNDHYYLNPVLLDACFQPIALFSNSRTFIPATIAAFYFFENRQPISWSFIKLLNKTNDSIECDIMVFDTKENLIAKVNGLVCKTAHSSPSEREGLIEENLYRYQWILDNPIDGCTYCEPVPLNYSTKTLQEAVVPFLDSLKSDLERIDYIENAVPLLNKLCRGYIFEVFQNLDWIESNLVGELPKNSVKFYSIAPTQLKFFQRLIEIFESQVGCLGNRLRFKKIDNSEMWNTLLKEHPSLLSELLLVRRCGANLMQILLGEIDVLESIFLKNLFALEHLYQDSPFFRIYHLLTKNIISSILPSQLSFFNLRVLEIGGGTGGLTAHVLPGLPRINTEYHFTDISSAFLQAAQEKFKGYPFLKYELFNLEKEIEPQGFQLESFDLVLISDVLHATTNLKKSLATIHHLLKPNGILIFTELTRHSPFLDLIFGSLKGWWSFNDGELRTNSPLISGDSWMLLLNETGYADCCRFSEDDEHAIHTVFVAKKPEDCSLHTESKRQPLASNIAPQVNAVGPVIIWSEADKYAHMLRNDLLEIAEIPIILKPGERYEKCSAESYTLRKHHPEDIIRFFHTEINSEHSPIIVYFPQRTDFQEIDGDNSRTNPYNQIRCFIQALAATNWGKPPIFLLVTFGVQQIKQERDLNLLQSPIWGLKRTIENEHPDLITKIIDLSFEPTKQEIQALSFEIMNRNNEDEIAIRGINRYHNRLVPYSGFCISNSKDSSYSLVNQIGHSRFELAYQEAVRLPPKAGQVEIKVHSVSMNFKDVATLLGLIPEAGKNDTRYLKIGYECSGTVTKIGDADSEFKLGDEVFGLGWGCYSQYVCLNADHIVHKPRQMHFTAAATIPIAFLTAYYALVELAEIKSGEKVLIHTASGGVGLAAIQISRELGAEIYATAGTQEKRDFLKALNIDYVGDSRSLLFANEIQALTNNHGVDIVINTLPGPAIVKGLEVLSPVSGRFIDISNFHNNSKIEVKHLRKGVATFVFDLEQMAIGCPKRIKSLLTTLKSKFKQEKYHPLPFRLFSNQIISSAFDHLKRAGHIGKICIRMDDEIETIPGLDSITIHPDKWYLIAGGYGGFGFATAQWLIQNGARHLSLIGRTGRPAPEVTREIDDYRKQGITVDVAAIDITVHNQVHDHLSGLNKRHGGLGGVVHAAMVMDIKILMDQEDQQFMDVVRPKILGAWNLHQATRNVPLEFFILYSSVTAVIGFPGQAAYSASNYFLNQLALYRKTLHLPATSISWGAIGSVGYLKRNEKSKKVVIREGFSPLPLADAWKVISITQRSELPEIIYSPINWSVAAKYMTGIGKSPRFSLVTSRIKFDDPSGNPGITDQYSGLSHNRSIHQQSLNEFVLKLVASIARIPIDNLKEEKTFEALHFDSLLAVELGVKLNEMMGVDLPKVTILQAGLTVKDLIKIIGEELARSGQPKQTQHKSAGMINVLPENIDLLKEAVLPEELIPSSFHADAELIERPQAVFLTGATGFLGSYLLRELLTQTNADVYCLVRSESGETGKDRIISNLKKYGCFDTDSTARIIPVIGDLSKKHFSLSKESWQSLCNTIDVIYHSGAWLNFAQPYSVLKPTNVEGTIEAIRLAATGRPKPLHYVSSLAKLAQTVADPARIANKSTTLNNTSAYDSEYIRRNSFNIGYHQSKWVADELVLEASYRGLPITIYRPSLISGDSITGVWNTNDYICQLIKGCIYLGTAPLQDAIFDFCPVDYIAKAIIFLSSKPDLIGNGFLIKNPNPISWNDFILWFNQQGFRIDLIPPGQWLDILNRKTAVEPGNPLSKLLPLFEIRPLDRLIVASPSSINSLSLLEKNTTQRYLKNTGIQCPPADDKLLATYLTYLKQSEFFKEII